MRSATDRPIPLPFLAALLAACAATHGVDTDTGIASDSGVRPDRCASYLAPPAMTSVECRSDVDCRAVGGSCWAPGDVAGLHQGGACPMACLDDPDCGSGAVCESTNGGVCRSCVGSCTPGSCGPWEACGDDGHCHPARCESDGYVCPIGSRCGPSAGEAADAHGCTLVPCADDATCGCGACVLGTCALGPGLCELPRP